MPANIREAETSMQDTIANNEKLVLEEKKKRKSCASAVKQSLESLNEFLKEDLKNSEDSVGSATSAELGG